MRYFNQKTNTFNKSAIMRDAWANAKKAGHAKKRFAYNLWVIWSLAKEEKAKATQSADQIAIQKLQSKVDALVMRETLQTSFQSEINDLKAEIEQFKLAA